MRTAPLICALVLVGCGNGNGTEDVESCPETNEATIVISTPEGEPFSPGTVTLDDVDCVEQEVGTFVCEGPSEAEAQLFVFDPAYQAHSEFVLMPSGCDAGVEVVVQLRPVMGF